LSIKNLEKNDKKSLQNILTNLQEKLYII